MSDIKRIYLDVDGVLADFTKGALEALQEDDMLGDHSIKELLNAQGEHDIYELVGLSPEEIFASIDKRGIDFWANLEKLPWFDELVGIVKEFAPFTILTATTRHWTCPAGKLIWLQKHFGGDTFRDYALAPRKWNLSSPGGVLIDDKDENVHRWVKKGGMGIIFPRVFNESKGHVGNEMEFVRQELRRLRG